MDIVSDWRLRTFRVVLPDSIEDGVRIPLVIVLHGAGTNGKIIEGHTGFSRLAETEGFAVVYPNAHEGKWNDGRFDGIDSKHTRRIDDVAFLKECLEMTLDRFPLDKERIHVVGASNGGMMTHRLLSEATELFAAGAAVISSISDSFYDRMKAKRPVPILMINGTEDAVVPWCGGNIRISRSPSLGRVVSVDDSVALWVRLNGCGPSAGREWLPDVDPDDDIRTWRDVYPPGEAGAEVVFYGVQGGGHTWPGGAQYLSHRIIGRASRDMDATRVIWDFFKGKTNPSGG
jgi:polyhydroxybutyrate depolymerase